VILTRAEKPSRAGNLGDRVQYVGCTISVLASKTDGFIDTRQNDLFLFQAKKFTVQIPYDKIHGLEYGQPVGRRYAEAILISPVFLLSKIRKHFLTAGFTNDHGRSRPGCFKSAKTRCASCW
jgi:hypothetical protein